MRADSGCRVARNPQAPVERRKSTACAVATTREIDRRRAARLVDGFAEVRRLIYMLTPEQTNELRARLQADLTRLADHAHTGLEFTMDRDRDRIGRDSMDEATEEETYSTELRLRDREAGLLAKVR